VDSPEQARAQAAKRLVRPIALTRAGMVAERVAYAFWPLWSVLFLITALVAFGLHDSAPLEAVWLGALASVVGSIWAAVWGIRNFRWPARRDAVARLDGSLQGRPIQALADTQAIGADDAASVEVWRTHVVRMADRLTDVDPVKPTVTLAKRDPYALRFIAATALAVALLFGSIWRVATVGEAIGGGTAVAGVTGPSWEGWIEPPAYTRKPSLYLADLPEGAIEVPHGSQVSVRLYGEVGALTLSETVSGQPPVGEQPAEPSRTFEVTQAGDLVIEGPGGRSWSIELLRDAPPAIELSGSLDRDPNGQMSQPFTATDDYGVVAGSGVFKLDMPNVDRRYGLSVEPDPRPDLEIDLPLSISGDRREFSETIVENFAKHPWAGLPVTLQLTAVDDAGQEGLSAAEAMPLPGRRFFDPLASAIIEQRRDLLWARANGAQVVQILRAVSHLPDDFFRDASSYLQLRTAIRRLDGYVTAGLTVEQQEEIAEALWTIALGIEEGDLSSALERLRRIQDQLSEAIENGASDEEIAELMQELREAMQDYMR
ncbi:MAG: DUF4175 family protein, partial [Pseudomonadota bacterium]